MIRKVLEVFDNAVDAITQQQLLWSFVVIPTTVMGILNADFSVMVDSIIIKNNWFNVLCR